MKLYCVRHGEAESSSRDPKRPLTVSGQQDVRLIADFLKQQDTRLSTMLYSPQLRAVETAEILQSVLSPTDCQVCPSVLDEDASIETVMSMIQTWTDHTMLVGHLPFLSRLISRLVLGNDDLFPIVNTPPAGVVCLEHFDRGRWIIQWIVHPRMLTHV